MKSKEQRREEAEFTIELKKAREINSLSVTFLRSASILMVQIEHVKRWKAKQLDFTAEYQQAMLNTQPNEAAQMVSLALLYYASLFVVIEGWRDPKQAAPKLADARIDELLKSPFVDILGDFRNAVLHPNSILDKRLLAFMGAHPDLLPWAMQISDEFLRYFREWRLSLPKRTITDL